MSSLLTELSDAATRLRLHPPSAPGPDGASALPLCEARIDELSLRPSIARRSHTYRALTVQATQDRNSRSPQGRGSQTGGPSRPRVKVRWAHLLADEVRRERLVRLRGGRARR